MNVSTTVYTHVNVAAYITDKMLLSLGNIIRDSGLNMQKFVNQRDNCEIGIKTWLASGHLEKVILEVFDPLTNALVKRWDFHLYVDGDDELGFWFDPDDIRYHLLKAGKVPSKCGYTIVVVTKPGRPNIPGWSRCDLRDTSRLRQFCLGTTISADKTGTRTSYWR
jgi:Bacterial HORMA domain 2